MADFKTCPSCGSNVAPDDVFCANCGTSMPPAPEPEAEPTSDSESWESVHQQLQEATRGRFVIERELGVGGMAAVYLAHEIALDRKVAIKVMSPGILMEKGMLERFKQEAVTIAALKHPNIITVHSVEHHDQLHFFVLEFIDGGSLSDVIKRAGPLPGPVAAAWFAQVGEALDYAHRRGVIHRDIKPANILIDSDGNAVVTDFGIAKVTEKSGMTMTGMTMGTPAYMSPEQCFGNPVTGSSDQYSLGIVAYETLAGKTPFQGSALVQMRAHTEELPRPLSEIRPDCPAELASAIHRMLEKEPPARWPAISDAMAASGTVPPSLNDPVRVQMIALATGEAPVEGPAEVTPETPPPGWSPSKEPKQGVLRRHLVKFVAAGATAVAAALVFIIAPWDRPGPPVPPVEPTAVALEISPQPDVLTAGESISLQAVLRDSLGAVIENAEVTWSSDNNAVATVVGGLLTAVEGGEATILAMGAGATGTLNVTVEQREEPDDSIRPTPVVTVASVRVSPDPVSLSVGRSQLFAAAPLDSRGRQVSGRTIRWSVGNPDVVTVSAAGEVTARSAGTTEIVAIVDGVRGSATVTVETEAETVATVGVSPANLQLNEGQTSTVSAVVTGSSGSTLQGRVVTWQSSNPNVASVSDRGIVTALAAGTAVISATSDGQVGETSVTVVSVAPEIDDATAAAQVQTWIDGFVVELNQAVRARDLDAVRRAYGVAMPSEDETEWRNRLALDGRWQARPAEVFPVQLFGDTWLSDFHVEIEFQGGGRSSTIRQRFRAGFKAGPRGLELDQLRMQIGQ